MTFGKIMSVRSHLGSMASLNVEINYVYSTTHKFLWTLSQIQKTDVYSMRHEFFSIEHVSTLTKRGIDYTHKIAFTFKCRCNAALLALASTSHYTCDTQELNLIYTYKRKYVVFVFWSLTDLIKYNFSSSILLLQILWCYFSLFKIMFRCVYRPHFHCLSVDGLIDCSRFLTIMNKVALNMDLHVLLL